LKSGQAALQAIALAAAGRAWADGYNARRDRWDRRRSVFAGLDAAYLAAVVEIYDGRRLAECRLVWPGCLPEVMGSGD
jgi:uncharacterized protein YfiM (DUF2279 family)